MSSKSKSNRVRELYQSAQELGQIGFFAAAWDLCEEADRMKRDTWADEPTRKLPIITVR